MMGCRWGCRVLFERVGFLFAAVLCFHLVPSRILLVYFLEPLGFFLFNIMLIID